jgi:hypothetical protein
MEETQRRFDAATGYVRRAIEKVATASLETTDVLAARFKVDPIINELRGLEAKWLRATSELERTTIARDAEHLADRTKENLPGAPGDWRRTNLATGEIETQTPASSIDSETNRQAGEMWSWLRTTAGRAAESVATVGKWFVVGGAVLLGLQLAGLFERAERRGGK